ncbi:MAG: hypothetical protein PHU73_04330 [Patescibacteria group bacterium]|nr:hypothetical protein [Patescibacteria group bacterium]
MQNHRNRKLNRLKEYDYSQDGWYFITICVKNRIECFGEIKNGEMKLNECGEIVNQQWLWLEKQYYYVRLDEYVVMPNHCHGILIIDHSRRDRSRPVPTTDLSPDNLHPDRSRPVPTTDLSANDFQPNNKIKSLSELIGAFKTTSSKIIHQNGKEDFAWQRSFYDHIIRNENLLNRIREYIRNNPLKCLPAIGLSASADWQAGALDRNNAENLWM